MVPPLLAPIYIIIDNWIKIMYNDNGLNGFKGLPKALKTIIGKKGFVTGMTDEYLKWYKEAYHPMKLKNNFYNYQLENNK